MKGDELWLIIGYTGLCMVALIAFGALSIILWPYRGQPDAEPTRPLPQRGAAAARARVPEQRPGGRSRHRPPSPNPRYRPKHRPDNEE